MFVPNNVCELGVFLFCAPFWSSQLIFFSHLTAALAREKPHKGLSPLTTVSV